MKYLIFDFNGTILNDTELGLECINRCIDDFLNRDHLSLKEYRNIFTFPVKHYYEVVGFDFDVLSWEEVGRKWMDYYEAGFDNCQLYDGIKEILIKNHLLGNKNIVLSASKLDMLKGQLDKLDILDMFDEVLGIDNIYATSKLPIGLEFIKDKDPNECLMIGDTLHDGEVARAMGVECVLVARGHQSKDVLCQSGLRVYDDIREALL